MEIYRIQNQNGYGPYASGYMDVDNMSGPTPKEDGIKEVPYNYIFGFKSVDQIYDWFSSSELDKLSENGYQIYIYEVSQEFLIEGSKQICFHEEKGILISVHKIGTL